MCGNPKKKRPARELTFSRVLWRHNQRCGRHTVVDLNNNTVLRFPHRRSIVNCQSCGTFYRRPPPVHCPDCRKWHGAWRTLQANKSAMQQYPDFTTAKLAGRSVPAIKAR
jgi:hypothetical protein